MCVCWQSLSQAYALCFAADAPAVTTATHIIRRTMRLTMPAMAMEGRRIITGTHLDLSEGSSSAAATTTIAIMGTIIFEASVRIIARGVAAAHMREPQLTFTARVITDLLPFVVRRLQQIGKLVLP